MNEEKVTRTREEIAEDFRKIYYEMDDIETEIRNKLNGLQFRAARLTTLLVEEGTSMDPRGFERRMKELRDWVVKDLDSVMKDVEDCADEIGEEWRSE